MANSYTQLAEQFPWRREAAEYACALRTLVDHVYFQWDSAPDKFEALGPEWPDAALIGAGRRVPVDDRLKTDALAIAKDMDWGDVSASFEAGIEADLYVSGGESPSVETIARILQATMIRFNLPGPTVIEWANTCDKLRAGEFTGGAAVITQASQRWMNTTQWAEQTCAAMEREAALDAGFESA